MHLKHADEDYSALSHLTVAWPELLQHSPAEAGEAGEVLVGGDPFAAVFDGEGSEPGVRDEVAGGAGLIDEIAEDRPVARAGVENPAVRLGEKSVGKAEDIPRAVRLSEDFRVRGDAEHRREYLRGDAEGGRTVDDGG